MKHIGKKSVKRHFTIEFIRISGLQNQNDSPVHIQWKRGERESNHGTLEEITVKEGIAAFTLPPKIEMDCTMFIKGKGGYDQKLLKITVCTNDKKVNWEGLVDLGK